MHIAFIPSDPAAAARQRPRCRSTAVQVACVITFRLTATYMLLPVGFGHLPEQHPPRTSSTTAYRWNSAGNWLAMAIPVFGMIGLLIAVLSATASRPV